MRKNPYAPLSDPEKLKIENDKKDINARLEAVAKLASECLADEKFKHFKDEFNKQIDDVFDKLAQPIESDPIKDAHYLRACINTILVLRNLINRPQKDIKKG